MPWSPYYGTGDSIASDGSKGGRIVWEQPSLQYSSPVCGPQYGHRKGGGVLRIIGSPDCNKRNRGLKIDASFKGSYAQDAHMLAQVGFDHFTVPIGLWGSTLQDSGWNKVGRDWVKVNPKDGKLEASVSQSWSFGLKCPGGLDKQTWLNVPMVKIKIQKTQYTVKEDCSTHVVASESYAISFDPKISANFLREANDAFETSDAMPDLGNILGLFVTDYVLSGIKVVLGPAFSILSGIASTPIQTPYFQSEAYKAYANLILDVPVNGGLMIGE